MSGLWSEHPTWLHRVPAGWKLLVFALGSAWLYAVDALWVLALVCALAGVGFLSLGAATQRVRRMCLYLVMAAALVAGFHVWLGQADVGLSSALRLVAVGLLGWSVTVSTRQGDILDVLEWAGRPFERWGWRSDALTLRLALMLRFMGHFMTAWYQLEDAYRLRSARPGRWRLLAPLTIQMLLTARRVADTLHVRLKP